jgi:PKHD-type hydroxylase
MIIQNKICCFTGALPARICNHIVDYAIDLKNKENKEKLGLVHGTTKEMIDKDPIARNRLLNARNSNVTWMDDTWIYKEIQPFVEEANKKCNWNFNWEFSEKLQFTKYSVGQFYTWHQDSFQENHMINEKMMCRKLSVTVSLSNHNEYEGGELEFDFLDNGKGGSNIHTCKDVKIKGSIVVFPSFLWHRVTPVTQGTRYSLVMWNNGVPWK